LILPFSFCPTGVETSFTRHLCALNCCPFVYSVLLPLPLSFPLPCFLRLSFFLALSPGCLPSFGGVYWTPFCSLFLLSNLRKRTFRPSSLPRGLRECTPFPLSFYVKVLPVDVFRNLAFRYRGDDAQLTADPSSRDPLYCVRDWPGCPCVF